MVVVMIPFSKTDQRNPPTIMTTIVSPMRLRADHVTQGINGKGGIENQKHARHASREQRPQSAHQRAVPPPSQEKRERKATRDDGPIVRMLPLNQRILGKRRGVFRLTIGRGIEEPPAMTMPPATSRVIGVFMRIRARMMTKMIRAPNKRGVLHRPATTNQEDSLQPGCALKTSMAKQAMIANGNTESRECIEDRAEPPIKGSQANRHRPQGHSQDRQRHE